LQEERLGIVVIHGETTALMDATQPRAGLGRMWRFVWNRWRDSFFSIIRPIDEQSVASCYA
jgi:hypothetical protein